MSSRILIAIVVSLIEGLLLGRIGPQADLRRLQEQNDELQKELAKKSKPGAGATLSGMKNMFKVSQEDLDAGSKARRARESVAKTTNMVEAATPIVATQTLASASVATQHLDHASMSNQIEKIKKAWALRADIARSNFIARTKLDEKQTQDFDVLVEAMNLRLGASIDKWVATIKQKGQMTPELGVRMMTDLGGDMVTTYDELDRKLPGDWRQNAGQNFEMVNFVDPEVLTPLQELDGIANASPRGPGQRRGGIRIGVP
jgi:hypothetical protein